MFKSTTPAALASQTRPAYTDRSLQSTDIQQSSDDVVRPAPGEQSLDGSIDDVRRSISANEDSHDNIKVITKPRKRKRPTNSSDQVDEYIFTTDESGVQHDSYDSDAAKSHISVSSRESADGQRSKYALDERPWLHMNLSTRHVYEQMFMNVTHPAIGDSWVYTEEYQHQVDLQMSKYLEDFPPALWTIGQEIADKAVSNLRERSRWRELGIRIYNTERVPELLHMRAPLYGTLGQYPLHPQLHVPMGVPKRAEQACPAHPFTIGTHQSSKVAHGHGHSLSSAQYSATNQHAAGISSFDPAGASLYASILLSHADRSRQKHKPTRPISTPLQPSTADDTDDDAEVQIRTYSHGPRLSSRGLTPPYPQHVRSDEHHISLKLGTRHTRMKNEEDVLPWHRQIDFKKVRSEATWNDKYRDPVTISKRRQIWSHNKPIVAQLDGQIVHKQRESAGAFTMLSDAARETGLHAGQDDMPVSMGRGSRQKKDPSTGWDAHDLHHGASLCFESPKDEKRARMLGCTIPDDVIEDGELGKLEDDQLRSIRLCWRPGKNQATHNLHHASFTALESVITRRRLADTPVLTWSAAECIIDFCPDILWQDTLLRICSESGMSNRDARERICLNGFHLDEASFTRRISAALGRVQDTAKTKNGDSKLDAAYDKNREDFDAYIKFFGKHETSRSINRRASSAAISIISDTDDVIHVGATASKTALQLDGAEDDGETDDGVSVQDSDDLDMLSD